jgi:nitrite reductase/ring-hydroxylating ferredoxin subunit
MTVCPSAALVDGGDGVRFEVWLGDTAHAAFAIRYEGRVHAFLNRCAHAGVELDWQPGRFFDADGMVLICSTHGALYDPATGACLGGPCRGAGLVPVAVDEIDGEVILREQGLGYG